MFSECSETSIQQNVLRHIRRGVIHTVKRPIAVVVILYISTL